MKLDEMADDVGLDVNGEALLARGEQLVKLEVQQDIMKQLAIDRNKLSNGPLFSFPRTKFILSTRETRATCRSILARVNRNISTLLAFLWYLKTANELLRYLMTSGKSFSLT